MKPSNTLEEKERFFATNWGAICVDRHGSINIWNGLFDISDCHLELKPLSSITDEEAVALYKIYDSTVGAGQLRYKGIYKHDEDFLHFEAYYDKGPMINYYLSLVELHRLNINCVDFLRSKSYALPYMGVPVETLVSWGWVKLVE